MTAVQKVACFTAILLAYLAFACAPAEAQFMPLGTGGGGDMMAQMAPMLELMKAKMGKRRFATLMQTMGPMMAKMMEGGGAGGIPGLGGAGDATAIASDGASAGGGDIASTLGGIGGTEIIGMIPQLIQLAGAGEGFGGKHRRRRR